MDASTTPTTDATTTCCMQPAISPNDALDLDEISNTDALDLDQLTSASDDEAAVLQPTSSASPRPASDTDSNWKLAITRRQRQRQKNFHQARTVSVQLARSCKHFAQPRRRQGCPD
ncbi:hypothetical protein MTO96_045183 [Rhipicephalus appendiculatus]